MEILNYNLITDENLLDPSYDLSKCRYSVQVVFERTGNVLILGMVNDYVYWASYTNVEDKEVNAAVFNEITRMDLSKVSAEYKLLPKLGINWDYYKYLFKVKITPREDGGFDTPFGHGYSAAGDECGKWFAADLRKHLDCLRDLCKTRESDGLYVKVLEKYLMQLVEFTWENYNDTASIRAIIENEKYLALSDNEAVRDVYTQCVRRLSSIYNEYMTQIH